MDEPLRQTTSTLRNPTLVARDSRETKCSLMRIVTPYMRVALSRRAARFTLGESLVRTVEVLEYLLVRVVRLQLDGGLHAAHRRAERGERAVTHLRRALAVDAASHGVLGARLPDAEKGLAQVPVGLPAVVYNGLVHNLGGGVGEGQDLLAQTLEHLLVVVDDAEAKGTEQLGARHHRVDRVALFEVLCHEVVASLAEANLRGRGGFFERGVGVGEREGEERKAARSTAEIVSKDEERKQREGQRRSEDECARACPRESVRRA
eukprot:4201379-Pleurochrysis_carterae.AAC.1